MPATLNTKFTLRTTEPPLATSFVVVVPRRILEAPAVERSTPYYRFSDQTSANIASAIGLKQLLKNTHPRGCSKASRRRPAGSAPRSRLLPNNHVQSGPTRQSSRTLGLSQPSRLHSGSNDNSAPQGSRAHVIGCRLSGQRGLLRPRSDSAEARREGAPVSTTCG